MNNFLLRRIVAVLTTVLALLVPTGAALAVVEIDTSANRIEQGRTIAFDRGAGNCLSCHVIKGGELPGLIGPPLLQMKLRYPDRAVLRAQIFDAAKRNPNTVMPPYGRNGILTEDEIDLVVDFIQSL